jgi:hypothetical protein
MKGRNSRRDPAKEQFWRTVLQKQRGSGLKIREFCRRQGLADTAFHAWRREIHRRDRQAAQSKLSITADRPNPKKPGRRSSFLPVALSVAPPPCALEIALPSGVVLRVRRDCDLPMLRAVLAAALWEEWEEPAC